ncbi:hypothetical protein V7S43_015346 [Phytophthora oleae]|uniref:Uncharacterized protein n=1 Tax=Phytophthora oleae TaxID=2107226 RepID=A0ABD3EZR0_9STRA
MGDSPSESQLHPAAPAPKASASDMDNAATIVPYNKYGCGSAGIAVSGDESSEHGVEGTLVRRNRLLAVTGNHQEFSLHEEVVLMENNLHRERLEHEMWESRRRIDEQGAALEHRSQQLLNDTHDHVEQSRAESERRIEAYMEDKINASKDNIQDNIREQTQTLAHQIQGQLYAERQNEVNGMEMRFTQQSTQFHQAIELLEQRSRADVRKVSSAQVEGWNEQLEEMKQWAREYVYTTLQTQDEFSGANQSKLIQQHVDHRLSGYEDHVEDLISARIRAERDSITKTVRAYTSRAQEQLVKQVEDKVANLTAHHNRSFEELKKELSESVVDVQQKVKADLVDFENAVGGRTNAEVRRAVSQQENAIQQQLQHGHVRGADVLPTKFDVAVEQAMQSTNLYSQGAAETTALHDCLRRQRRVHFGAESPPQSTRSSSASRMVTQPTEETTPTCRDSDKPKRNTTVKSADKKSNPLTKNQFQEVFKGNEGTADIAKEQTGCW